ncbi:asparagine synthase (glutamine-hydrolysing)/amidotransferase [Actinacidiphila yanglinensis]|uniref:asparagine synthase (glutamine-hydrolyzing) n=1 Tax=Actinacidiphila yanglinensis TaxID=310779 RepID=A0A1H6E717_9ACTN|nr:asparagine synthase (glutamine-hydrolyzing) [Actinacidiphila yanglinensis]SEG93618.1 asparagine synthase (glutamine-hydrolysing)/amidotransferase [Actinacidiphila yanglinensis]
MCGIAGWIDFDRNLAADSSVVERMTRTMACRGPDAEGVWIDHHAALGHRRLAVIDLEGGRQPMTAEDDEGRTLAALTFCGEVYNYRELRAELIARGHRFRTDSDTEVVLRGYLQWGERLPERLNGMFALAVWDTRTEELMLLRDRMGVKPLFYLPTEHGVLFGSEPKAILANPRAPRRVSRQGLCEVLDMVKTPEVAVFDGMAEVRPGHMVRVSRRGLRKSAYWRLEAREHTDDLHTTVATVRGLLEDIVARQMVSDVPLCMLLSGGLDSSTVTALAARASAAQGTGAVRSFSVDFTHADEGFAPDAVRGGRDAPFVRDLAEHVGSQHTEVILDSDQLTDPVLRAAVLTAVDQPPAFWGDMWPSLYLLFRAVKQHSTVALSGEAADELFGGYRWFRNPKAVGADTFPWLTAGSARYFGGLALLDKGFLEKIDIPGYRAARYHEAMAECPTLPGEGAEDRMMRKVGYLNLTRFVNTLLDRKDRMSMGVGLEVRVPFCDHRLVEYVFNTPWAMKSFDGREKSLLRAAAADLLPRSVLERVKSPYPATQDPGYEQVLRTELAAVLADPDAPVLPLLDRSRAAGVADRPLRDVSLPYDRGSLEMALWLNSWLTAYDVTLDV